MYIDFLDTMLLHTEQTTAESKITSVRTGEPNTSCDSLSCSRPEPNPRYGRGVAALNTQQLYEGPFLGQTRNGGVPKSLL